MNTFILSASGAAPSARGRRRILMKVRLSAPMCSTISDGLSTHNNPRNQYGNVDASGSVLYDAIVNVHKDGKWSMT
jgi:hypothetical protein